MFAKDYARYYEIFNQDKQYKKEIELVYKWAEKPSSVFDLGCGLAHYWKHWPKGVFVRGIEKSKDMISHSPYKQHIFCQDLATMGQNKAETAPGRAILYDLATCLFDVINYLPGQNWWQFLPIKPGGYFVFDVWNKAKVDKEGFRETVKKFGNVSRRITPIEYDGQSVDLAIEVIGGDSAFREQHKMYLYSHDDILEFAGNEFELSDIKETKTWQTWYRLRRK